jgi:PIN domain nuclease of toxin-antitoxin system
VGQSEVILLDTHVVVWLALDIARISRKAKIEIARVRDTGEGLGVSDISLLEIATLERKRRIALNVTLETFLWEVEQRFTILPITGPVCVRTLSLPSNYPDDPADRVIGATALVEGIHLVTADEEIRRSKAVATVW